LTCPWCAHRALRVGMSELAPCGASAFRQALAANAAHVGDETTACVSGRCLAETIRCHDCGEHPGNLRGVMVATILAGRRARLELFSGVRLADPSWDIILDLYASEQASKRMSVSDACVVPGVPVSTALRHVNELVEHGYVVRSSDPSDRRRTFLHMSGKLYQTLETWLDRRLDASPLQGQVRCCLLG